MSYSKKIIYNDLRNFFTAIKKILKITKYITFFKKSLKFKFIRR